MHIGITGQRGTLARYLYQYRSGHAITFLDRNDHVNKLRGCDVIIHAAAYTNVANSNIETEKCWHDNVTLTKNIVEMCKANDIYLIFISTLASESASLNHSNVPVEVLDGYWSAYSQTKLIAELTISLDVNFQNWTVCRVDSIFGKNSWGTDQKFVGKMMKLISEGQKPTLINITGLRPTYAKDVARHIMLAMIGDDDLYPGEYKQLTNDAEGTVSLVDYYSAIEEFMGTSVGYEYDATKKMHSTIYPNITRTALRDWKDALKDYIDNE